MTVETSGNQVDYTSDGANEDFVFNFKTYDPDSIQVYEDDVLTVATVIVTLNLDQDTTPGGSVNVVPAPAGGVVVSVLRIVPLTQLTDYITGGPFPADAHEQALDKLTFIVQQMQNVLGGGLGGGGAPPSISPGAMLFAGALFWEETLNSEMTWDDTNKRLGINVAALLERLHMQDGNFLVTPGTNAVQGSPPIIGSLVDPTNLNGIRAVFVFANYAYTASYNDDSMQVIDITDPVNPEIVGSIQQATDMNGIFDVVCDGHYVYAACSLDNSLRVIDVSDPTNPTPAGFVKDNTDLADIRRIYLSGHYIYAVCYGDNSLRIIDISNPTAPEIYGTGLKDDTDLEGISDIFVVGEYAYVVCYSDNSLRIIDISDPTTPTIIGGLKDDSNFTGANSIYIVGKYAYFTASSGQSLQIVDVSDPTTPVRRGGVSLAAGEASTTGVIVAGDYAYVGGDDYRVYVVDITDAATPVLVATRFNALIDVCQNIVLSGKYVYVSCYASDSLQIIDISGIKAPSASIGSLFATILNVAANALIGNNVVVGGGMNIGRDLHVAGNISASGKITTPLSVLKTTDESVASSTTLQDDDELFLTLEANGVYEFEALLIITSDVTPDFKYLWNEADGTFDFTQTLWETGAAVSQDSINEISAALAVIVTGTTENFILIKGIIIAAGAGGTLQLQWAQNTSDAGSTVVKANSYLRLVKLN